MKPDRRLTGTGGAASRNGTVSSDSTALRDGAASQNGTASRNDAASRNGTASRDGAAWVHRFREAANNLGETALDLLFPRKCPFCGRLSRGICPDCDAALPWTGEADGLRDIGFPTTDSPAPLLPEQDGPVSLIPEQDGPVSLTPEQDGPVSLIPEHAGLAPTLIPAFPLPCAAALRYDGLAREGLLRMKFHGKSAAAEDLGALIAHCAAERLGGQFDTVTWVPVSARRRRKRGYDQAELLARAAGRLWDTAPLRLLDKVRDNPAQSGLSDGLERQANVSGVYRPRVSAAGRRVLLVDDICTTGATLRECAAVLYEGGAANVVCAAVAFAGLPGSRTAWNTIKCDSSVYDSTLFTG